MTEHGTYILTTQKPDAEPWPRVLIGLLPERNGVPAASILFDLIAIAQRGHAFIKTEYTRTDLQRNKMAEYLLKTDFTHLLMLDADHRHPPDVVERLVRWVKADPTKEVVAGLAFRRCEPYDPNVFIYDTAAKDIMQPIEWEPGLAKVDIAGSAVMLISRDVFERLPKPWFAMDYSGAKEGKWPGEDIWFCELCSKHGVDIWTDFSTISPHLREGWVDEGTFRSYRQLRDAKGEPEPLALLTEADLLG